MVKRMLIDATHPEETRVVVVNGTRLEELDVETSTKKQIKGNIYLAKVIRVEPSLQAAFVDYGGNRHGFLAFSEIHPDYFQIPVADRQALLAAQKADVQEIAAESARREAAQQARAAIKAETVIQSDQEQTDGEPAPQGQAQDEQPVDGTVSISDQDVQQSFDGEVQDESADLEQAFGDAASVPVGDSEGEAESDEDRKPAPVDTLGGDDPSDQELERRRARLLRNYKIQEVIKRRQIMLVQVVKEERGNKGAALTTYLSLAGRYCVLMPNTARGGGVSRKITNTTDRRRLKSIAQELECPDGMAVIVRTAGSERSKTEIRRDYEYLLRAWDSVRDLTLRSSAPACVYEEASLIKRSIRDLYTRDIDEVLVDGDEGYRLAKDYMRMLTPSHAKKVQPYKDPIMPMFQRYQVEAQLDAMHSPVVQLRSGGYIVIGQTEALVAIDVNSGRATKERHIEETALKTNLEAAEEIARQLRLRDLAGLIVIDFIDMEENRNNNAVERRLKDSLKSDRARIQVGKISAFGLLELSRQRLRPSLQETSFSPCPHCAGTGLIRSVESSAMHVLRAIEEEGIRRRSAEVTVFVSSEIALYILNQKRDALAAIEERYQFDVYLLGDDSLIAPNIRMERVRAENRPEEPRPLAITADIPLSIPEEDSEADEDEDVNEDEETTNDSTDGESENDANRRRRRRRRRSKRKGGFDQDDTAAEGSEDTQTEGEAPEGDDAEGNDESEGDGSDAEGDESEDEANSERRKRRRGRRGGRRRRRGRDNEDGGENDAQSDAVADEQQDVVAAPVMPVSIVTLPDAVADVFEQAERAELDRLDAKPTEPAVTEDAPQAEEEKPARRRAASRKKAEAVVEGEAEAEAPAAKKPRSRSKKAATENSEETVQAEAAPKKRGRSKAASVEAEAGDTAAEAEPAAKKQSPRRAPRKSKAAEASPAEPVADDAAVAEAPAAQALASESPVVVEAQVVVEDTTTAQAENKPDVDADAEALPPAPTRRGWWNKLIS